MQGKNIVIVDGKRTPFGNFGGALRDISAVKLAAKVIKELLHNNEKAIEAEELDQLIIGHCLPGLGLSPGRQVVLEAGLQLSLEGLTVDRACCSALTAAGLAFQLVKGGEKKIIFAGGMENMSQTPYLIPQMRWGQRLGDVMIEDELVIRNDYLKAPMAKYTGEVALEYGVDREQQDEWSVRSHMTWTEADRQGKFAEELVPVSVPQRKSDDLIFSKDEHPRPQNSMEKLAKLKPVYESPTVTAGNASGICDGATGLLITDEETAEAKGIKPLARIVDYVSLNGEPRQAPALPAEAINICLEKSNLSLDDMELIEINEAFAATALVSSKLLGDNDPGKIAQVREKLNVNGGAVAIGHPIGATGARLVMTLAYELRRRKARYGVAAICGALGQADAMIIESI